jgi:hypothetical protein
MRASTRPSRMYAQVQTLQTVVGSGVDVVTCTSIALRSSTDERSQH